MSIIIGIDHGYYAIKTAHCSFPAGLTSYGEHEPYTRQGLLEFGGCFFVCGSGRQPMQAIILAVSNLCVAVAMNTKYMQFGIIILIIAIHCTLILKVSEYQYDVLLRQTQSKRKSLYWFHLLTSDSACP